MGVCRVFGNRVAQSPFVMVDLLAYSCSFAVVAEGRRVHRVVRRDTTANDDEG